MDTWLIINMKFGDNVVRAPKPFAVYFYVCPTESFVVALLAARLNLLPFTFMYVQQSRLSLHYSLHYGYMVKL